MEKDNLENLFKKSFENFEPEVNSGVWSKIQNALKATGMVAVVKSLLKKVGTKTMIAVISSSVILFTTFFLMNIKDNKTKTNSEPRKEVVPDRSSPIAVVQMDQQNKIENKDSEITQIDKEKQTVKKDLTLNPESIKKSVKKEENERISDSLKHEVVDNLSSITKFSEFSPNGDGQNDEFIFQSKNIKKMKVVIYDKDANIMYNYTGIDGKWDGKNLNGEKANEGYYLYLISAEGVAGKKYEQKGKVKLTR